MLTHPSGNMDRSNITNTVHAVFKYIPEDFTGKDMSLGLLFSGIMVLLAASVCTSWRNRRHLPPGPRGWPLLGSALDMPRQKEWLAFTEWKRLYGHSGAHIPLGYFTDSHCFHRQCHVFVKFQSHYYCP